MLGYVKGSQLDRDGRSGQPVSHAPTYFDTEARTWRLRHGEADVAAGLRAYVPDLMEVLRCHQDFQLCGDDAGLLRAYVAKYVSKFSDAAAEEWLNDDASATSLAATVLMRYKPLEPEMALQLHGARFRQWQMSTEGGGKRDFVPPCPDSKLMPREVILYGEADWARGRVPLLDFLRKTTDEGKIGGWLEKIQKRTEGAADLPEFAAAYKMQGEKVVAADMLSHFNDRFYGQWLMLRVPFEDPSDFLLPAELAAKVPACYKYFAMALLCRHPTAAAFWQDDEAIAAELRGPNQILRGHRAGDDPRPPRLGPGLCERRLGRAGGGGPAGSGRRWAVGLGSREFQSRAEPRLGSVCVFLENRRSSKTTKARTWLRLSELRGRCRGPRPGCGERFDRSGRGRPAGGSKDRQGGCGSWPARLRQDHG
ncbi:MAG: hypothetical protein NXI12_15425, partial [Alphaproteobacteria bacterium]|nr:hypothetical protein [Alphaproteobacteria bacterium]